MATTDRIDGLTTAVAIKAPVRVASTGNLTLSGEQTIDGVSVVSDDRVLVKDQTTATENGIYVADSSAWSRASDSDGNRDLTPGTLVLVRSGTINANTAWRQTTVGTGNSNNIVFDTDSPAFEVAQIFPPLAGTLKFSFDSSTTTGEDPGDGDFRLNNATVSSATVITFSNNSAETGSPDVSDYIATWDDSTNTTNYGTVFISELGNPSVFAIFSVTGTVTDGGDYLDVTVTYSSGSGALTSGTKYGIQFIRSGDQGSLNSLTPTDGNFIVGDGSGWVAESGATARTSLGLGDAATKDVDTAGGVQGYDADTAKTDVAQSFTAPQRADQATVTDGTLDLDTAQNFHYTPSGADTLEFSNETVGQSGFIYLVNGSNHTITLGAEITGPDGMAAAVSATGNYLLSYWVHSTGGGADTVAVSYVKVV